MATGTRIAVKGPVLRWAREEASLDEASAASRAGVKVERLRQWEQEELAPTLNQLRRLSDVYERPLAAFFMSKPPAVTLSRRRPPDFRRREVQGGADPVSLQKAIARAYRQRDALMDIAEAAGQDLSSLYADFSLERSGGAEQAGEALRAALQMASIPKGTVVRPEEYLRVLVRRAEGLGVTVIQVQRVDAGLMRGFSLAESPCPVVALNGGDWPRGKIYTLLHELAHVGFRASGLCDLQQGDESQLERLCEATAAAALIPRSALMQVADYALNQLVDLETTRAIGNEFGVSGEAALLRLIEVGRAQWDDYWRLKPEFEEAYRLYRAEQRELREDRDPPPIFYQLKVRDLGRRFIRQVLDAYGEESLSSRDLVQLLEVSYDKIPRLQVAAGDVAI